MSIIGKTIVAEECWSNNESGVICLHYFLISSCGQLFYLMVVDEYDQYERFVKITQERKDAIIADFLLKKVENGE